MYTNVLFNISKFFLFQCKGIFCVPVHILRNVYCTHKSIRFFKIQLINVFFIYFYFASLYFPSLMDQILDFCLRIVCVFENWIKKFHSHPQNKQIFHQLHNFSSNKHQSLPKSNKLCQVYLQLCLATKKKTPVKSSNFYSFLYRL